MDSVKSQSDWPAGNIWRLLTKPASSIVLDEEIRRVRLLTVILLLFIPFGALVPMAPSLTTPGYNPFQDRFVILGLVASGLGCVAYAISRTKYYQLAAWFFLAFLSVIILEGSGPAGNSELLHWLAFPILLGSILLQPRGTVVFSVICCIAGLLLPVIFSNVDAQLVGYQMTFVIPMAGFLLLFSFYRKQDRNQIDQKQDALVSAQLALQKSHDQLEARVQERTSALARSNAELEQFAYIASHDLQEPLRMVASFTQLLAKRYEGQLDDEADEFIGFAVDGALRMQKLLRDLLAYSRVGSKGVRFEPVDFNILLKNTLDDLKLAISGYKAEITFDSLPTVMGDETQLMQLLQNLIGNALKFCGERVPQIHVGAERRGDEWLFSMRDNGIGINPTQVERIFLIFQRLHTNK